MENVGIIGILVLVYPKKDIKCSFTPTFFSIDGKEKKEREVNIYI